MRNLKVVRQLRGQTASGMRRRLRKAEVRNDELEKGNHALAGQNSMLRHKLRTASQRPIPIAKGFVDMVVERYADCLGRTMADKAIKENPEIAPFARRAGEWLSNSLRNGMGMHVEPSTELSLMYEEMTDGKNIKLSMRLHNVTLNYADDLNMIRMMRFVGPGSMPADAMIEDPRPHVITNADISASCSFLY